MGLKLKRKGLPQKGQMNKEISEISDKPKTGVSASLFRQTDNLKKGMDRKGNIKRGVGVGRGKGKGGGRKKSRTKSVGDTQIDFLPMDDRQFVSKMDWILEDELEDGYVFKKVTLSQQKKMEGANVFHARRDLKRQIIRKE